MNYIFRKNPLSIIRDNSGVTPRILARVRPIIIILIFLLLTATIISFAKAQNQNAQIAATGLWIEDQTFPTVTTYITVTRNNVPLDNLAQENFTLSEDDIEIPAESVVVEPTTFKNMHLVLALDISTPPEDWAVVKKATQTLLETLGPDTKVSIFGFGDQVQAELPEFTNNTGQWQDALNKLAVGGEFTALYETIVAAAEFIKDNETDLKTTRTAVIIMTDSRDNVGRLPIDDAIDQAELAQTPFYVVGYGNKVQASHPLKERITVTGGQYFTLPNPNQVQDTLQRILSQLEKGYKITFSSTLMADAVEHNLNISVNYEEEQVSVEKKFTAVPAEIEVSLPDISEEPIVRGPLKLVPEILGPAPISSVTYLLDNEVMEEVTKVPYEYIWDNTSVAPGTHLLNIYVVDSVGNTGNSETVVTLAEPIVVQIPVGVGEIEQGNSLTFEPQIETDVGLAVTELWLDDTLVDSCNVLPCTLAIDSGEYSIGTHTIRLLVEDVLGQKDDVDFQLKILPPPPPPVWLERLGNQIGFQDYSLFKWWLNLSIDAIFILTALFLIILLILMTGVVIRRIIRIQRQRSRKQLSLEIVNLGNIRSSYALWAEDPLRFLQFQFAINGIELPYSLKDQVTHISERPVDQPVAPSISSAPRSPAVAASPPAVARTGETGRKNGQQSNMKQSLKQSTAKGGQALGLIVAIAGILNTLARLLPGPLGRPIRRISGRLTSGQSKIRYVTQRPTQIARQANRLQSQVSQITPSTSKPGSVVASQAMSQPVVEQQIVQEETSAYGSSLSPPATISANAPAVQTGQLQKNRISKKQQHPVYHTVIEPAETPVVAPGSKLIVDLMITPSDPFKARDYQFTVCSNPVKQRDQAVQRAEAVSHISGMSWLRRYLPRVAAMFIALILALFIVLLTYGLTQLDIIPFLETLG